jgi:hypothetical protein
MPAAVLDFQLRILRVRLSGSRRHSGSNRFRMLHPRPRMGHANRCGVDEATAPVPPGAARQPTSDVRWTFSTKCQSFCVT